MAQETSSDTDGMITLHVDGRPVVECREVVPGAPVVHSVAGSVHSWFQGGKLLATWMRREPAWPPSPTGYRFVCHYCVWCWPVKWWLPFDFELARWAHRRHVRRRHPLERPAP